ncbi:non-heme iron oxygenase ferredoxin subunit [Allobranchiibius huperziae]|uniref:3-phenylpropionate/trans-cinnamate dioxygenase ferredoxin subunit n=1 Tax=Allobranchiibius huperziae TaxID=1874116 RepID=A0A853DBR1_9MICO|nr:non-heme iron oxygenase ferredoxin subunit [Allobranchiibius huperziae]NYJ74752.1 3-phenylpropionate/trans-cinnamate dioxygenase ferredoxin subunit [Allobranchiibius huperziae]
MTGDAVTADFVRVCSLGELTEGEPARADIGGYEVALVRTETGEVFAVDDTCSHANVSLSEGEVEGCTIECWLHGSRFDLRTGNPDSLPAIEPIATYPVKIDGDDVFVAVPTS